MKMCMVKLQTLVIQKNRKAVIHLSSNYGLNSACIRKGAFSIGRVGKT